MSRFAVFPALLLLATPAYAQSFQGNWACRNATGNAGLLTIYGSSYLFASPVAGDKVSGSGTVQGYSDGVGFVDGQLKATLGVEAGRLVNVDAGAGLQLETSSEVLMLCTPL